MHKFGVKLLVHWQKLLSFCGFAPDPVFWGFVLQHAIKRCTVPLDSAGDFHPRLSGLNCPPTSEDLVYCTSWAPVIYVIIYIKRGCQIVHTSTNSFRQPSRSRCTLLYTHSIPHLPVHHHHLHHLSLCHSFSPGSKLIFSKILSIRDSCILQPAFTDAIRTCSSAQWFFILVFHFPFVFVFWL